jgi:hypothetical protein
LLEQGVSLFWRIGGESTTLVLWMMILWWPGSDLFRPGYSWVIVNPSLHGKLLKSGKKIICQALSESKIMFRLDLGTWDTQPWCQSIFGNWFGGGSRWVSAVSCIFHIRKTPSVGNVCRVLTASQFQWGLVGTD